MLFKKHNNSDICSLVLIFIFLVFLINACSDNGSENTFTIHYYNSSWSSVNIHYNNGDSWTTAPGESMTSEGNGWWVKEISFPDSTSSITFVFNDGNDTWDNNRGDDYTTSLKESWVINGQVSSENPTEKSYQLTIHYKKPSYLGTPLMHMWIGESSTDISSISNDSFGAVYSLTTNGGFTYGLKFKDSSDTWEQDYTDRNVSLASNSEFWIVGESRALFTSNPASLIESPAPASITNKLGATVDGANVNFVLFAPRSKSVALSLNGGSAQQMKLTEDGKLWWLQTTASDGDTYKFILDGSTEVADPYAKANEYSNGDSIIIDLNDITMDSFTRPALEDIFVYELHINDMTDNPNSGVSSEHRGKYLGLTNKIPYLQQLGINAIEVMPMQEFSGAGYSWGYNNSLYFAPESDFATANDGIQVSEFKQMVNAFHDAGIAVLLDVVYNHTANYDNHLWQIDNEYYFDPAGTPWGNKFNVTESRPMVKRFVYDNLKYWMEEYAIDGFRFDGVWEIDNYTLLNIINQLRDDGYNDQYYIVEIFGDQYFSGKTPAMPTWSSEFRDGVKYCLANSFSGVGSGGSDLAGKVYYCSSSGYQKATDTLLYLESHDEETMGHLLGSSSAGLARGKMGGTILATSLGIPMMYEGQEFHRDKGLQDTSEENNMIDWDLLASNTNHYNYFSGLVNLRTKHDAFQADENTLEWAMNGGDWDGNSLRYFRKGTSENFLIVLNFKSTADNAALGNFPADGTWRLIADMNTVDTNASTTSVSVSSSSGTISVPANSAYIYMHP